MNLLRDTALKTTNTISILQYTWDYGYGTGIGTVVKELSLELQNKFYKVETLCGFLTENNIDDNNNITILGQYNKTPKENSTKKRLKEFIYLLTFYSNIRKQVKLKKTHFNIIIGHAGGCAADILIAHSCHKAAIMQKIKSNQYKWILNPIHYIVLLREWITYKFGKYKTIICISQSEAKTIKHLYRLKDYRITVVPNGVNLGKFKPATTETRESIRKELKIPNKSTILLFVANEFERKGLKVAIDALFIARQNNKDVRLIIAGAADPSSYCDYAHNLGILDACSFIGPRRDTPSLMSTADIVLVLSDYEPFGLVGIEALACGTPVIATPVGGMLDYIQHKQNGLFSERNSQDVYQAIIFCLDLFKKNHQTEATLRKSVESYSWKRIASQYETIIKQIAGIRTNEIE